jgi:hypothetical protein
MRNKNKPKCYLCEKEFDSANSIMPQRILCDGDIIFSITATRMMGGWDSFHLLNIPICWDCFLKELEIMVKNSRKLQKEGKLQ